MDDESGASAAPDSADKSLSKVRLHLTITRAQPLLLEEAASLDTGLRSPRIASLANLGLLVERGFFSGEFFNALQAPEVQRALMGYRATSDTLDRFRGNRNSANVHVEIEQKSGVEERVVEESNPLRSQATDNDSGPNGGVSDELEPGRGVRVEQQRPVRTVRMP
ncbi:hypothetical protein D3C81_1259200 [compost metagenome]